MEIEGEKTYTKHGLTVSFPRLLNISDPGNEEYSGGVEDYQIDHPVDIALAQVQNHLRSLYYQYIETKEKPEPIFTDKEAAELAPLFKAALGKVGPNNYVQFKYQAREGMTEGEVFASVDYIHWRFNRIKDVYYTPTRLSAGQVTWKLVRGFRGQNYHKEKTALMKIPQENWLLIDKNLPPVKRPNLSRTAKQTSPRPVQKRAPQRAPGPDSGLEEKLHTLKELRDQGLINENDYQKKKEELLNQHL